MSRRRRRRRRVEASETMSAINITPLTDVLLVLLIIFFVTAASSENRFLFQERGGGVLVRSPGEAQVVRLEAAENGFVMRLAERDYRGLDELSARLTRDKPVILSAEDEVSFGDLVTTLDGLRARDFTEVEVEVQ